MIFSINRLLVEIADEVVAEDEKFQQIQTGWWSVLYDSPNLNQAAQRVAQIITQMGGYRGTIRMQTEGRNIKYYIQRDPAALDSVSKSVTSEMQAIVLKAFPKEKVRIQSIDEKTATTESGKW